MRNTKKGFTLVEIMIVVVIIGLLAAMAIPAFNKVRESSQEKAIINNLRQVASAGQQYLLETGEVTVGYQDLVDGGYFKEIAPVAGEVYTGLSVTADGTPLSVTDANGKVIEFEY